MVRQAFRARNYNNESVQYTLDVRGTNAVFTRPQGAAMFVLAAHTANHNLQRCIKVRAWKDLVCDSSTDSPTHTLCASLWP